MIKRFAEGLNYSIELDDLTATCRVWSRPDLTSAEGAALAQEKVSLFQRLAQGPTAGMLFDLTLAPIVTGPKTQLALGEMSRAWQDAGKPIAVVVGPQSIQQLQLRRILSTSAPDRGALFTTSDEALVWLRANLRRGAESSESSLHRRGRDRQRQPARAPAEPVKRAGPQREP